MDEKFEEPRVDYAGEASEFYHLIT